MSGIDIVKRLIQGVDFTLAARAMMFAVGCIHAQRCRTNRCPVGLRRFTVTDTEVRAAPKSSPDPTDRRHLVLLPGEELS